MRRAVVSGLAFLFLLCALSWAQQPDCSSQKKGMLEWEAKMKAAWAEWQQTFDAETAARLAYESARDEFQRAIDRFTPLRSDTMAAIAATNACHEKYGFSGKCAHEERAEAAARDKLHKACMEVEAAFKKMDSRLDKLTALERKEQGLYRKADSFERSYLQAVDNYNACLRGKPKKA